MLDTNKKHYMVFVNNNTELRTSIVIADSYQDAANKAIKEIFYRIDSDRLSARRSASEHYNQYKMFVDEDYCGLLAIKMITMAEADELNQLFIY